MMISILSVLESEVLAVGTNRLSLFHEFNHGYQSSRFRCWHRQALILVGVFEVFREMSADRRSCNQPLIVIRPNFEITIQGPVWELDVEYLPYWIVTDCLDQRRYYWFKLWALHDRLLY